MKRILSSMLILTLCLFSFSACDAESFRNKMNGVTQTEKTSASEESTTEATTQVYTTLKRDKTKQHVKMVVKNYGTIILELDESVAPITVKNFVNLVKKGFYNGITFHRIMKGFMIQGGDPTGTGTGGSKETIKGEFSLNGVNNTLSHKRGVLSMARGDQSYDSASSQFFICTEDNATLDGQYAAFGWVVSGMDVVDKISDVQVVDDNGTVLASNQPVITKMTMDD